MSTNMRLIDSHIHLDFAQFDADRRRLVDEATTSGIAAFVIPGTTQQSWNKIASVCDQNYPQCYAAYGLHPYFIDNHQESDLQLLKQLLHEPPKKHPVIAIGEIGLDYYLPNLDRARQQYFFFEQLKLAAQAQLPVILHARKAVQDVTLALIQHSISSGIIHSYNGSLQQAQQLIEMGFKLGFGGSITYPRATRLRQLVRDLPLSGIVLETDAPDQPSYQRAKKLTSQRNTPIALIEVFDTIVELRNESRMAIAEQTWKNTMDVLPKLHPLANTSS